jgi:hypothetical protein
MALRHSPSCALNLTESQFRAIGHVTAQWAILEYDISREIVWLLKRSEHKHRHFNFQTRFSTAATTWLHLARRSYKKYPVLIHSVERIGGRAIKIKSERDQIVHGMYTPDTFLKVKGGLTINISDSVGRPGYIEDLACRISDINADLIRHQAKLQRHFRTSP